MNTFALDFETYYDKDCSIKTLGPLGYFSHPNFDAYMVSVVGDEGTEYVGHPKDFNWSLLGVTECYPTMHRSMKLSICLESKRGCGIAQITPSGIAQPICVLIVTCLDL